jgi:hypothetical protein
MSINKLQLKRSAVVGKIPTTASLDLGELAINTIDGKIYFKQQDTGSTQRILELSTISGSHLSASYAQTSSYSDQFRVSGVLTAQTLIVQTISSSIIYSSGSNIFGNDLTNTQNLTDSSSFSSRTFNLEQASASLFLATASLNAFSASINNYTSSNNTTTASINAFSASINNFTASQLILNGTYATTASNTFIGTETVTGSVNVYGGGFNVNGVNVLDTALAYAIALG